jgi:hypothetical protein
MTKFFHSHLLSGTDPVVQLVFGCRAIGANFRPRASSFEEVRNGSSIETTSRRKNLDCSKNYAHIPFKFNCVSKRVTSQPRKLFDVFHRPFENVLLSRNLSLQSQVPDSVLHPRSKRPILKYIHQLDELLSALAPYARCSDPFEGSFRGIEACMAMNHLHRLRFQCQVLFNANCRLHQARSHQLTTKASSNFFCPAGKPKRCNRGRAERPKCGME